jgi:hypothetical protein
MTKGSCTWPVLSREMTSMLSSGEEMGNERMGGGRMWKEKERGVRRGFEKEKK